MKKLVKIMGLLVAILGVVATTVSCNPEPDATDLEFSYADFSTDEGVDESYISVYLMETPYKFPVVVDMDVEMLSGKDSNGKELMLADVITFITSDEWPYNYKVTPDPDNGRKAKIEGVEVTYTNYNRKIYFSTEKNHELQSETITIKFTLTRVEGSEMGSQTSTILTIVDDKKAPAVKVGYYDTRYTAPADATREGRGQFYMRLQKVGKYDYVASELFGLPRPRLLGTFDPEAKTLTFDGTDYDHKLWAEATADDENPFKPINAFRNDTIWGEAYNEDNIPTQVLKLRGSMVDDKEAIVMTTEEIAEDSKGVLLSIDTPCGLDIYSYNLGFVGSIPLGVYDSMESSESMTFGTTNYPLEVGATRSATSNYPKPFSAWQIEEINQ